ncbi:MAG: response regulator transcription factor [Thermoleophilia bacterium]|nr:response regulator transcription factor [Thermoleophilia bacterium]
MSRVLVAEDEERIARFVERGLRAAGYAVDVAGDATQALAAVRAGAPDLMVLDLGLPDTDGLDLLAVLRGEGHRMPVIVLTARDGVADKVAGFERGADDYITKPFAFEELLARVRARLRDSGRAEAQELVHGDLRLDLRTRRAVTPDLGTAELSAREFALLEALMRHPGAIRSREELLDRVWGFDFDPGSNVVEVYIRYLRKKVGAGRIRTVRGSGYAMN